MSKKIKYLPCFIVSIVVGTLFPLAFAMVFIGSDSQVLPKIGMESLLEMPAKQATAYVRNPENMYEVSGFQKKLHYAYEGGIDMYKNIAVATAMVLIASIISVWWSTKLIARRSSRDAKKRRAP